MLFLPKRQIPSVTTRKPQTVPDGGTSYKTPDSTLVLSKSVKVRKDQERQRKCHRPQETKEK